MNYKTNLLLIALGCILLSSCNSNSPKPCFEMSCESITLLDFVYAGEEVLFKNCSDNGISYSWDFGDGTSSTLNTPRHAWETAGTYTVTLNVENEDGEKSITQDVTIEPSIYGIWDGKIMNGNYDPSPFTLDITPSANNIKGEFTIQYAGSKGAVSSSSQISGDSVSLTCTISRFENMLGNTYTSHITFIFKGTINQSLDKMEGDQAESNSHAVFEDMSFDSENVFDGWEAVKRQ